ncbi:uncharacterized protein LOC126736544 isoform X2 [Anthonomus grandis grandis]|uniref:uncharacterized protein LOC126736544 isoform X2 n=1 Tax=Anthonomus grandis grandis TaxID=2921223 RepID=UPI002165A68D|nr:uncharacterized protein LOC126736544 isoform X2 [Anthonomus grandis grandis]
MSNVKPFCVICKRKSDKLKCFEEKILCKCREILKIRQDNKLTYCDVVVPKEVNEFQKYQTDVIDVLPPCRKSTECLHLNQKLHQLQHHNNMLKIRAIILMKLRQLNLPYILILTLVQHNQQLVQPSNTMLKIKVMTLRWKDLQFLQHNQQLIQQSNSMHRTQGFRGKKMDMLALNKKTKQAFQPKEKNKNRKASEDLDYYPTDPDSENDSSDTARKQVYGFLRIFRTRSTDFRIQKVGDTLLRQRKLMFTKTKHSWYKKYFLL